MDGKSAFSFYRKVGVVVEKLPAKLVKSGSSYFVLTSLGSTYHIYDLESLNLLFVGPEFEKRITDICGLAERSVVCDGSSIVLCKRSQKIDTLTFDERVSRLLEVGDLIICCMPESKKLCVIETNEDMLVKKDTIAVGKQSDIVSIIHPDTYINKILISFADGVLQLWNIRSKKMIYEFPSFNQSIACVEQSPVVDIVAIGFKSGDIFLLNLKSGKITLKLKQNEPVNCVSFRNDGTAQMITGGTMGTIYLWDLDEEKLMHKGSSHKDAVSGLTFLSGRGTFLSSSLDGSIKIWLVNESLKSFSMIKERSGLCSPVTALDFYDEWGTTLVCGTSKGSLSLISTVRDSRSFTLSCPEGEFDNPISCVDHPVMKHNDWATVVSTFSFQRYAQTWWPETKRVGDLKIESSDKDIVSANATSSCGNYSAVGSLQGSVTVTLLESGRTKSKAKVHEKRITGLVFLDDNSAVVSVSLDGYLKFTDPFTGVISSSLYLGHGISSVIRLKGCKYAALSLDNNSVVVFDIDFKNIIRQRQFKHTISSMVFSPDGRSLLVATSDLFLHSFDIVTGLIEESFRVKRKITCMSYSPNGTYLAIASKESLGVELWVNNKCFAVSFPRGNPQESLLDDSLSNGELTFSQSERSKWKFVVNQDVIKARNKPKMQSEIVSNPLPFLLDQSISAAAIEPQAKAEASSYLAFNSGRLQELLSEMETDLSGNVSDLLSELSPAQIEMEIMTLDSDGLKKLSSFLHRVLTAPVKSYPINMINSLVSILIKHHFELMVMEEGNSILPVLEPLESSWKSLESSFTSTLSLINHLR